MSVSVRRHLPTLLVLGVLGLPGLGLAACEHDGQCKGERICVEGECVFPDEGQPGCEKDTDCPGELVCEGQRCVEHGGSPLVTAVPDERLPQLDPEVWARYRRANRVTWFGAGTTLGLGVASMALQGAYNSRRDDDNAPDYLGDLAQAGNITLLVGHIGFGTYGLVTAIKARRSARGDRMVSLPAALIGGGVLWGAVALAGSGTGAIYVLDTLEDGRAEDYPGFLWVLNGVASAGSLALIAVDTRTVLHKVSPTGSAAGLELHMLPVPTASGMRWTLLGRF